MTQEFFEYRGQKVPFTPGESVAAALEAAGHLSFGKDAMGHHTRYFCGIGACQSCLVRIEGVVREACISPARQGLQVESLESQNG